ncbi:hypothetical protein NUU61_009932 [Penicillium alfredii]|uniref:Uncharacterized protein n=1 Tax=Penicillium alfredii TaxID=1506179 RepID=A0A9W9EH12_9EURO|nr:uncharacterized protein NUU61_009932 [Penicillium alfredii]KAJ5081668.1 hypothetical protein NUU61_009932 [Penicillium alfredii]
MAGKYDFGKDTPDLDDWAGVVAHEISHVLSLPHQSQSPHALDQMELNSEAFSISSKKKKAFTDACQDMVNAKSYSTSTGFKTEFSREPERYAPFNAPLRLLTDFFPRIVNWDSITFYNRPVDAKKKKTVFNKKDGGTVPFSSWKSGPNQADIDQVNDIYKSPLGTVGAPPDYDCED